MVNFSLENLREKVINLDLLVIAMLLEIFLESVGTIELSSEFLTIKHFWTLCNMLDGMLK